MSVTRNRKRDAAGGFALVEVMVAMVIILIGVLGVAGMQLLAYSATAEAGNQNTATTLASSMAAKMVANGASGFWGAPPAAVIVNGSSTTGWPSGPLVDCTANTCNSTQMAYYDLSQWQSQLSGLPSGYGSITCPTGATPAICTIWVSWQGKNVAVYNPTGTEGGTGSSCVDPANASNTNAITMAAGSATTHCYQTLVTME